MTVRAAPVGRLPVRANARSTYVDREQDDERGRDLERRAEHAVEAEILVRDDVVEVFRRHMERTGHEIAEVRVEHRDYPDHRQMPAGRTTSCLEHEHDRDDAEREVGWRRRREPVDDLIEIQEDVPGDGHARDAERKIEQGHALPVALERRVPEEREHEHGGQEEHRVDLRRGDGLAEDVDARHEDDAGERDLRAGDRVVQGEERGRDRDHRRGPAPHPGQRPGA